MMILNDSGLRAKLHSCLTVLLPECMAHTVMILNDSGLRAKLHEVDNSSWVIWQLEY